MTVSRWASLVHLGYAAAAFGADQRNCSPERHIACRMTDSLRAGATRAFPNPDLFAMARAQSFKCDARFPRVRITTAASYMSVLARPSPQRDMRPFRSVSPD